MNSLDGGKLHPEPIACGRIGDVAQEALRRQTQIHSFVDRETDNRVKWLAFIARVFLIKFYRSVGTAVPPSFPYIYEIRGKRLRRSE